MNKNLVVVAALVVVALIIVGAMTGWFGITGNVAASGERIIKVDSVDTISLGLERYEVSVQEINYNDQVVVRIKETKTGEQQTVSLMAGGEEVKLSGELGGIVVNVRRIYHRAGADHALVKLKRV